MKERTDFENSMNFRQIKFRNWKGKKKNEKVKIPLKWISSWLEIIGDTKHGLLCCGKTGKVAHSFLDTALRIIY